MHSQTYFLTRFEEDANRKNDTIPLQVNCTGAVSRNLFSQKSIRKDFYYIYVLTGKMIMPEDTLLPGDVLIIEPGHPYQYKNEGETTYLWVHYTGYEAHSLTNSAHLQLNVKQHIGIHDEIIDCFQKLFKEFMIKDEAAKQISICLLREILYFTGRYAASDKKNTVPLLAIEYIHSHFKEDIEIDFLASMEHMSGTAFRNIFKKHTGVSPNEYLISHRISVACEMLSQTNQSISRIAADVGYADQYYFSRIFRKKVGIPPLKYRLSLTRPDPKRNHTSAKKEEAAFGYYS